MQNLPDNGPLASRVEGFRMWWRWEKETNQGLLKALCELVLKMMSHLTLWVLYRDLHTQGKVA